MGSRLWPPLGRIERYAREIDVTTFPTGERRVAKDPSAATLSRAFRELGTQNAVAAAFGVSRHVVTRWISLYGLEEASRPEVRHANFIAQALQAEGDRLRAAQWLMDEGSVGVTYAVGSDLTALLVGGSMNDHEVIELMSSLLRTPFNCSRSAQPTTLPMLGVRVQSAKAYALLGILLPYMTGLKAKEARAALTFFPPAGILPGRHTTDEFLVPVWREFAASSLCVWNSRRRIKLQPDILRRLAETWVEGRISRARRFVDARGHE